MKTISNLEQIGLTPKSKVLIVYPHPDDESYFSAGFIKKAVKMGCKVKLAILTKGEASTLRFGVPSGASLERVRLGEMKAAAKVLGVKGNNLVVADFPDGKLKKTRRKVTFFMKKLVKDFKPNFILTFEPNGVYGHPDHIVTSNVVTKVSEKTNAVLLYATINPSFKPNAGAVRLAKRSGKPGSKKFKAAKPNLMLKLSASEFLAKVKALQCHKSQVNRKQKTICNYLRFYKRRNEFFVI